MKTHGMSGTRIWVIWQGMIQRCYSPNPNSAGYKRYYLRGIRVCDRWLNSFEDFYADVGDPPSDEYELDRPNNNGWYCPENWRWVTVKDNANNRENNHVVTIFGETKTIAQWGEDNRCKVKECTLRCRINNGWDPEIALATDAQSSIILEIFGEIKSCRQWSFDERCKVSYTEFYNRIKSGWGPERALTTPLVRGKGKLIYAFGENKTAKEWEQDERCRADARLIRERLKNGYEPEVAISEPPLIDRELTIFDETKSITKWVKDPRCKVGRKVFVARLKYGWPLEKVLTKPPKE